MEKPEASNSIEHLLSSNSRSQTRMGQQEHCSTEN
jgi:hypothetical protein